MLVERHDELGLLREMFADCRAGQGRTTLITGGLASGKSELLHTFCEHIAVGGALVLTAAGARAEHAMPMGVVWQLFGSAELPPEVLERGPHGIGASLLELARKRPVLIAVDDVQFVDAASLDVLRYVRSRMRSAAMMMVLAEWERPNLARSSVRAELTRQPHCRIAVGPLSEAGVAELVTRRLGADAAARLASGCYALAGGNPFLTHALIEDQARPPARRLGTNPAAPVVGTAFREAVLDCLHRWEPEFIVVAGGMAILGDRATPQLVADLITAPAHAVSQVFDVLTTSGLVRSDRLRHAEIVGAVLASLSTLDRSRLHARAAELLDRDGAGAVEVARHVAASGSVPGPWAVRVLRHAADQSLPEDAELAVRYLELALRACDDERQRVALRADLVRAAWRINPSAAATHLPQLHGALQAGDLGWRDAAPVVRHLFWQGDLRAAADLLQAMDMPAGQADVSSASELRLAGEWIYGRLRDRMPADANGWLATTGNPAPAHPWRRTATLTTLWPGRVTGTQLTGAEVAGAAEHVLQGCPGEVMPEVGAAALLALDHAGRWRRAEYWCEVLSEQATRQHATTWQAVLGCVRADIAWRRGGPVTAQAQASAALGLLNTQSWGVLIGLPLSILILAHTATGRYDAAAELLDRAVPDAMFDTAPGLRYLHASGHYNLVRGRPLAAVDDFERCAVSARAWGLDVPAIVPWRSDLAQAYLELGMRSDARALVTEQLGRPQAVMGPRAHAASLRVLAACSEPAGRVGILQEAVHSLERCADRLELGRALTDLSLAYREFGDLGNFRLTARRADEVAKACHLPAVPIQHGRRSAKADARSNGDRPARAGVAALSEAEHKVATLAGNGHSNREIGRKLQITVSTVEQHLTRVYRKLDVSGRTDLAVATEPRVLATR